MHLGSADGRGGRTATLAHMSLRLLGRPARTVVARAVVARAVVACGFLVIATSCGSDDARESGDGVTEMVAATSSTTSANVLPVATVPAASTVTTTVTGPVTTIPVVTAAPATALTTVVPTTLPPTTVPASSTTVIATTTLPPSPAVCDLINIIEQTQTQYDDIVPGDLNCAGDWASWVGRPADGVNADGFFAVAQWNGSSWELANLGTAEICAGGGVPRELWAALKCTE